VHWAQDIYPEIAEELGVLRKGGLAAKILRSLSARAMRRHNQVIVVGRCMKARLQARGIAEARLTVIPNWAVGFADCSTPHPSPLTPQPFTVLYSGNFGLAHPFESIIEAVRILDRGSAPVRFVFAGAGPRLNSLRQQLAACRNVEFRAPVPLAQLPASLAGADVHLACMSEELLGLVVPSKIYGAMATRPCIFLGPPESEAARALQESRRGVVLSARDSGLQLAQLLAAWSEGDSTFSAMRAACESDTSHFSLPLAAFHRALHP
jgi:colanic acid biosynthesis glycosyl transferase WcaI